MLGKRKIKIEGKNWKLKRGRNFRSNKKGGMKYTVKKKH